MIKSSVDNSLNNKSTQQYQRYWVLFREFQSDTGLGPMSLPLSSHVLNLYVAYLLRRGYAPSSVKSNLSAIGFSHRMLNLPFDDNTPLINKMLLAARKSRPLTERRMPLTIDLINEMLDRASLLIPNDYILKLFRAICLTAFYAFMRSGEFTDSENNLQFKSLCFSPCKTFMTVTFYKFKHMNSPHPWPVRVEAKPQERYCPRVALDEFVELRGRQEGPLFCWPDGAPIKREWFSKYMKICLAHLAIEHERYKPHSFRIGAATAALQKRMTHEEICSLGRWSSQAFKNYLRLSGLTAL